MKQKVKVIIKRRKENREWYGNVILIGLAYTTSILVLCKWLVTGDTQILSQRNQKGLISHRQLDGY